MTFRHSIITAFVMGSCLLSDSSDRSAAQEPIRMNVNVPVRTLGGTQFWSDELVHGKWRIQRNVLTGHFRLLDPNNTRRAWGTWEACLQQWNELKRKEKVPRMKKRVVLVLHGLIRTRKSTASMTRFLAQDKRYSVLSVSYASTRESVGDHAKSLARVVSNLKEAERIDFVAHSLGNLVIRHFLADQSTAARGSGIDPRIHHVVMIGPPNQGAELARRLQDNRVFQTAFGISGQQLGKNWDQLSEHLIVPPCPFGIIAGVGKTQEGFNPTLEGNDDMIVSVAETRLEGASDFIAVPCVHTLIMDHPSVQEYTLKFLQYGYFISKEKRHPIPAVPNR